MAICLTWGRFMCCSRSGYQQTFFGISSQEQVVNVASVPQRSPFRYPGGKTWLIPRIRQWLRSLRRRPGLLVEPFAGGAIVGLSVAFEGLADHVVLVELDEQVAAVWHTILSDESEWLVERILSFNVTEETVRAEVGRSSGSLRDIAFRTIIKNRTYHGGILAPGSSLIKTGEKGKGLRSRWYAATLARRIRAIAKIRDRFSFIQGDGIKTMMDYKGRRRVVFFIDPPYTAAGKRAGSRLYTHHALDHEKLFAVTASLHGGFLMTYDKSPEIETMARQYGFETRKVPMKNTHHAVMNELLIGRDLSWLG